MEEFGQRQESDIMSLIPQVLGGIGDSEFPTAQSGDMYWKTGGPNKAWSSKK